MSEFEAAAMVEAMSVDDDGFEARFAGAACISDAVAAGAKDMEGVTLGQTCWDSERERGGTGCNSRVWSRVCIRWRI